MKKKQGIVVDVKNLSVKFGEFYAVRDVSFSVSRGEIFGFLGANGAGKTTTIRVLCGLLSGTSGQVIIDGTKFVQGRENQIKQKSGYMSQRFTLYDELSVGENLDFAAALRNLEPGFYRAQRAKLLDFIGFAYPDKTVVKNLPGGIKQQVALCVSLLHDPQIVFLDEPTAGVSPVARMRFWALIKQLSKSGKTIFVTTHYMDEAENCTRIALMRAGELIAIETPEKLKQDTFTTPLYKFVPRTNKPPLPDTAELDMFEPYGGNWHIRFKNGKIPHSLMREYKKYYDIEEIAPSLEDVFIKLVEGKSR